MTRELMAGDALVRQGLRTIRSADLAFKDRRASLQHGTSRRRPDVNSSNVAHHRAGRRPEGCALSLVLAAVAQDDDARADEFGATAKNPSDLDPLGDRG